MKRDKFLRSMGLISGGIALAGINKLYCTESEFFHSIALSENDPDFWNIIREQFVFPEDYTYLNTGGIGALPSLVINKVIASMNEQEKYPKPGHSIESWNTIKEICAPLLGPRCKTEELALISCATEGINIILNGIGLKSGDEIITSSHEHPAVHVPVLNHHRINKTGVKVFDPDRKNAGGNIDRIKKLLTSKTRLIILSHVTCTTGQIFPVKEISELCRSRGIILAVDGAQAPGGIEVDLEELGPDYYTCSGHKWILGPRRTGILYVPSRNLENLQPTTVGAYSDAGYDIGNLSLKLHETSQRYEFGTQNEPLYLGLAAGAQFIKTIGIQKVQSHNRELAEAFYQGLKEIKGVEILSPEQSEYRTSLITFSIPGSDAREISDFLGKNRIRVRVVTEAGLNGVRVSFHVYNQMDEVEEILKKISEYIKK
jgi:selenocysteine lyase/cysteine desulfurase